MRYILRQRPRSLLSVHRITANASPTSEPRVTMGRSTPMCQFVLWPLLAAVLGTHTINAQAQTSNEESKNPIESIFKGIGGFLSNIVSPKGQKLKELVDDKKFVEASTYFQSEKTYFDAEGKTYDAVLKTLADGLNALRVPELQRQLSSIGDLNGNFDPSEDAWLRVKQVLADAERATSEYGAIELLKDSRFRAIEISSLETATARLKRLYESNAVVAFRQFDLLKDRNFFDAYPVSTSASDVLRVAFDSVLSKYATASAEDVSRFRSRYSRVILEPDLRKLGTLYVERLLTESPRGAPNFYDKLRAIRSATSAGFKVGPVKDFRLTIVQVVPDSLDAGERLPKVTTEGTQTIKMLKGSEIGSDQGANAANYLILILPVPIDAQRKVTEKRTESSKVLVGTRTDPNPAFAAAQAKFIQAQSEYNAQQLQNATTPTYGAAAAILRGISSGLSSAVVTNARNELAQTSPTITEPVYQDYQFSVTRIDVAREARYRLWIVDRLDKTVAQFDTSSKESKSFQIAYNLRDKDPDIYSYRSRYNDEAAIDAYEKSDISVKLSWFAEQVLNVTPAFNMMASEAATILEASTLNRRTSVIATAVKSQGAVSDDPRIECVVVIHNPKGGLGSGFYVADDIVITNYHVVEGSQMAEIRRRDGQVMVGRVLKTDIGLDLALIKVNSLGKPVQFASSPLATGATVEAIGHPQGLEFTVTRGIVSAVRKLKNPLIRGSREMLVIQTDAAISPGNSGGPLFLGTQVIGVNSQKLVRTGVEGIGFAIHYAEVQRFIQEP